MDSTDTPSAPWYLHLISALGGLLAGGLLLAFLLSMRLLESPLAALALGLFFTASAVAGRMYSELSLGPARQALLSISLLGQALIIFGAGELIDHRVAPHLTYLALASVLYLADRETIHRFLVALMSWQVLWLLALDVFSSRPMAYGLLAASVALATWLFSERGGGTPALREELRPIASAATLALLGGVALSLFDDGALLGEVPARIIVAVPLGIVLGLAAQEADPEDREPAGWAGVVAAALALVSNAGVMASILILALGFWRQRRPLIVLGSLSLVCFLIHFYYVLDISLLAKSGVLVGSGLVLLATREFLRRRGWMQRLLSQADDDDRAPREVPPC